MWDCPTSVFFDESEVIILAYRKRRRLFRGRRRGRIRTKRRYRRYSLAVFACDGVI